MCVHTVVSAQRSADFFSAFVEQKKFIDYGQQQKKNVATMARTDFCEKRIEKNNSVHDEHKIWRET